MQNRVTVTSLYKMKQEGKKITALTAYDYPFASMVDAAGIDILLVGDSLGMVVQGKENTLAVTMEEILYHTSMVSRACSYSMVIGDMPFMSYQSSIEKAVENAGRFLKDAGASAVKLEGGADVCDVISAISKASIPVQAHIGLTPQSVHQMGGFKVQRDEDRLMADALKVQDAGAFSVVLEGIPSSIAAKITKSLKIPTIGIGAGANCDGQILVIHDMLGISNRSVPKFVKKFANLNSVAQQGLKQYVDEVRGGIFPSKDYEYN
ncbi:MAG: 3-methyl-2-oxobutanoate hydroxymethyltransferase [Desulfamplus sp.]|nr:3-methyl-2-oxobutanoate hydroxymethyltransferase [Desulfamplus sp.]MBF0388657.1 3-methyl-2-oxobutanoate hydroxymethyltransferase [Desulfamplus sp.]